MPYGQVAQRSGEVKDDGKKGRTYQHSSALDESLGLLPRVDDGSSKLTDTLPNDAVIVEEGLGNRRSVLPGIRGTVINPRALFTHYRLATAHCF